MIALERAGAVLGGRRVVEDVTLRVPRGGWTMLIGPNGAGKTTLLRTVAGAISHSGRIELDGHDPQSMSAPRRARTLAIVWQSPLLPLDMTVREYVLLGRTAHLGMLRRPGARDERAVAQALRKLDLDRLASQRLAALSGGERQRATLARALAQEAPVLLLDEPTTALDVGRQQEVLELVGELRAERGLTVLGAMHDLTLAGQYADRLALLDSGRVVSRGRPADVLTEDLIARHYRARVAVVAAGGGPAILPVRPAEHEPPAKPPFRRQRSVVLVNTGDGKGKSTAAFGVVLRGVARGWWVSVIQFVKSDEWKVGEEAVCRRLGVDWAKTGDGFTWLSDDLERSRALAGAAWELARATIAAGEHQLVVLDEITYPINWGWISGESVARVLADRPDHVNVIATGRAAPPQLIGVADTVTEMTKVRHAYDHGVRAKRGIDF